MISKEEQQWARLIDGELSFSEQRALLGTLDDTPNGWKRLALGLLEAEAFRREIRSSAPQELVAVTISPKPSRRVSQLPLQATIACVIGLTCLGLGMAIEHRRQPVATFVDQTNPVAITFPTAEVQRQQTLKLVFADGPTGAQSVDVAVIDAEGVEAAELLQQSAVPDDLRLKLESQGYVIHEERTYVPISLANGRQGIAPISDVVVEYPPVAFQ
jgi:hypothetical protein